MKKTDLSLIRELLKELHLPAIRDNFEQKAAEALAEQSDYQTFLRELLELECTQRREKSVVRRLRESNLPLEKNFDTFDLARLGRKLVHQVSGKVSGTRIQKGCILL